MDKNAVLKIISDFTSALEQHGLHLSQVILYGSYATGRQHEGSDIDLIVVSEDFVGKNYLERLDLVEDALYELWEPIEAVLMTPDEWEQGDSMIAQFARKGECVYAK